MLLDDDSCYRAMRARDRRFDGRFFVGVASTRIYCRAACAARTPRRENCQFYATVAAAEAAGYRACLRCRPKLPSFGSPDALANGRRGKLSVRRFKSSQGPAFELDYRPPYDWKSMLEFLAARAVGGIEEIDNRAYRRTVGLRCDGREHSGWLEVSQAEKKSALRVVMSPSLAETAPEILDRVTRLMDVSANPVEIAAGLGRLAKSNPGLRVPGAFDGFEIGVRAILGQQVTVAAARTVASRFASAFGMQIRSPFASLNTVFPAPEKIAQLTVDHIARLGVLAARSRSIIALAGATVDGTVQLGPGADVTTELKKLRALPGIGEWTAQYIAMRALDWPDAFPHTDFGVMKALGETNPGRVLKTAEPWRPWRAYAVMHLWRSLHA
ncbi:MAG: DNA-3-methyladenine glycosylase 2 [Deltaproteobacteria bacterium]|nr:DNA-3-methyladenine glycosylase 2 [Deltaproteobacteria bacterium]